MLLTKMKLGKIVSCRKERRQLDADGFIPSNTELVALSKDTKLDWWHRGILKLMEWIILKRSLRWLKLTQFEFCSP